MGLISQRLGSSGARDNPVSRLKPSSDIGHPLKILVIGSLSPMGGTSVSLQQLIADLTLLKDVQLKVVNTGRVSRQNRKAGLSSLYEFFSVTSQIVRGTATVDVVTLHVGLLALPFIAPLVWVVARIFRKPLLIRRFGGNDHYELRGIKFFLADRIIRRAECYLAQTKAMVARALAGGIARVQWFPTSRPHVDLPVSRQPRQKCRRFLYLSHIRKSKGIFEIIDAAERFVNSVTVDIYGPFYEGTDESIFTACKNVRYHGVLAQNLIPAVLSQHDALLLPTYYVGEGYPGIILEAFSAGLPVIATRWKSIPELVDESCGMLVEPRDADALYGAMLELTSNDQLFRNLCEGASRRHEEFDSRIWAERFVAYCRATMKT